MRGLVISWQCKVKCESISVKERMDKCVGECVRVIV